MKSPIILLLFFLINQEIYSNIHGKEMTTISLHTLSNLKNTVFEKNSSICNKFDTGIFTKAKYDEFFLAFLPDKERLHNFLWAEEEPIDKNDSLILLENHSPSLDTLYIKDLARSIISNPCPEENMYGQTENICRVEYPIKQYFRVGDNHFVVTMVNFSFEGGRSESGKSIIMLFKFIENNYKLLDTFISEDCCTWGKGLRYNKIYKIGKKSLAVQLSGGYGGAGVAVIMSYFLGIIDNQIVLIHENEDSGINYNTGETWNTQYKLVPSGNEFMDLVVHYEHIQELINQPSKTTKNNWLLKFSMKDKKYLKSEK